MRKIWPPAPRPCDSCPYRRDVPSGVWDETEYAKLPTYDGDIAAQAEAGAIGVFLCHQQDGRMCAGWAGCHDLEESLALRMATAADAIDERTWNAALDYVSPVPLFGSGQEAADHGRAELDRPRLEAIQKIHKLERRLDARDTPDS